MASENPSETSACPFCKEQIKPDAVKCKHCGSGLTPTKAVHRGVCPYCKEEIHPDAIKCKHCKSDLIKTESRDCGCKQPARSDGTVVHGLQMKPKGNLPIPLPTIEGHGDCSFEFKCYPCTRCIPGTNICFESTCCDLVRIVCSGGVSGGL